MATYTVKAGDSLSKIANALGLDSWQELYQANKGVIGKDPDLIKPGQVFTVPGTEDEDTKTEEGEDGGGAVNPDPETSLNILQGSDMRWFKDGDTWYVAYGLPGSDRYLFYEATMDQMSALFGEGGQPDSFTSATFKNLSRRAGWTFGGSVSEMEGDGNFEKEIQKVVDLALDEGSLPSWMEGTPEAMDVLYIAQAEGKSNEWVLDQFSALPSFKQRFRGVHSYIDQHNLSLEEGIEDFLGYEAAVRDLEKQFGGNPDRVTPWQVGKLMNAGYTLEQVGEVFGRFDHMRKNSDALSAFNAVLAANDMDPLNMKQAYAFMRGNAPQDLYDIWEAASITEMAVAGGFDDYLDPSVALDYAYSTPGMLDAAQVSQASQKAAADLLRFRHELDLNKFGLSHEDLVDAAFGMKPRSGSTIAEVSELVQRAQAEAQSVLQNQRLSPFRDFNKQGNPAESLTSTPTR